MHHRFIMKWGTVAFLFLFASQNLNQNPNPSPNLPSRSPSLSQSPQVPLPQSPSPQSRPLHPPSPVPPSQPRPNQGPQSLKRKRRITTWLAWPRRRKVETRSRQSVWTQLVPFACQVVRNPICELWWISLPIDHWGKQWFTEDICQQITLVNVCEEWFNVQICAVTTLIVDGLDTSLVWIQQALWTKSSQWKLRKYTILWHIRQQSPTISMGQIAEKSGLPAPRFQKQSMTAGNRFLAPRWWGLVREIVELRA